MGCPAKSPPPPTDVPAPIAVPPKPSPPRRPPTAKNTQIDTHDEHTCAVRTSGSIVCWGKNTYGQLGDGRRLDQAGLVLVSGIEDAVEVRTGVDFSCTRVRNGTIRCWGNNEDGQLGDGRGASVGALGLVPTSVTAVRGAIQLAVGDYHACALEGTGRVQCWGHGGNGQIGSDAARAFASPRVITGFGAARAIASGAEHVCAVDRNGGAWCWGRNTEGQLGDGIAGSRIKPVRVVGITDAIAIASGSHHSCAVMKGGTVSCWGDNHHLQLGPNSGTQPKHNTPVRVPGLSDVVQVEGGLAHTCVRQRSNRVLCWGSNEAGQLGHSSSASRRAVPTELRVTSDTFGLALGRAHTCSLGRSGEIVCWGSNDHAALGPYPARQPAAVRVATMR